MTDINHDLTHGQRAHLEREFEKEHDTDPNADLIGFEWEYEDGRVVARCEGSTHWSTQYVKVILTFPSGTQSATVRATQLVRLLKDDADQRLRTHQAHGE